MTTSGVGPGGQWISAADVPAAAFGSGQTPSMLWSAKPAAASVPGATFRFTDVGGGTTDVGGGSFWYSNGTRYKAMNGNATLDTIDTANAGVANTSIQNLNPNHADVPAGVVQNFDRLRIRASFTKSGAADTATIRFHWGPLGTTADPVIDTITALTGANVSYANAWDYKRASATSLQPLGGGDRNASYVSASTGAMPAAVAVSNMDSNAMFLSVSQQMTGGTEFVTVTDFTLDLWTTDS